MSSKSLNIVSLVTRATLAGRPDSWRVYDCSDHSQWSRYRRELLHKDAAADVELFRVLRGMGDFYFRPGNYGDEIRLGGRSKARMIKHELWSGGVA